MCIRSFHTDAWCSCFLSHCSWAVPTVTIATLKLDGATVPVIFLKAYKDVDGKPAEHRVRRVGLFDPYLS